MKIFRNNIIDERTMKDYEDGCSPELKFFKKCKYFFGFNTCKSTNWNSSSPCYKCFKEGKYNPQNADIIDTINGDRECR